MRWFKHMTNTMDDEKIAKLVSESGIEAYGFYWAIIELVAKQIEKGSDKCSVTYPLPYLSRQLYLHHNRVSNLLGKLQVTGLILLGKSEVDGGVNFTISCPNLLKYRDEYASRRAKNRDKLPTKSRQTPEQETDTDTDTDTDTEAEENYPPPLKAQTIYADLLKALDKIVISPKEIAIAEKLMAAGCTFEDIAAARKEKNKNQLAYLQNIVCEMRDRRIKEQEAASYEPEFI
jgi:hypothetical protein